MNDKLVSFKTLKSSDGFWTMVENILNISQIILAILLIVGILLQARGTGLGAAFGGEGNVYRTMRGVEKRLFQATVVIAILFFGIALANVIY